MRTLGRISYWLLAIFLVSAILVSLDFTLAKAKVIPHVPVVPVGRRSGAAVRHGDPALVAGHALQLLVP